MDRLSADKSAATYSSIYNLYFSIFNLTKMKIQFLHNYQQYTADLNQPIDISQPLIEGPVQTKCFYAPDYETSPVIAGDFVGSTQMGGPLNFLNVQINPHGNGTHTECVGHIAKEKYTINKALKNFHFITKLVSITPNRLANGDFIISKEQLQEKVKETYLETIVVRTLPNETLKKQRNYSGTNPTYFDHKGIKFLVEKGVKHLLTDLPSVDREEDAGKLLSHRAFWQYPDKPRKDCTITELIYVPNETPDGYFLLNLQIASFEIDVSPSKPVLYHIKLPMSR